MKQYDLTLFREPNFICQEHAFSSDTYNPFRTLFWPNDGLYWDTSLASCRWGGPYQLFWD